MQYQHVRPARGRQALARRHQGSLPLDAAPPGALRPAERVVIDADLLHVQLANCLDRGDDAGIWQCHRGTRWRAECEDWLASLAGRVSREQLHPRDRTRQAPWHASLLAAPLVLHAPPRPVPANTVTQSLGHGLLAKWQRWIGTDQMVALFSEPLAYAQICCWSPVSQRECLARLHHQNVSLPARHIEQIAHIPTGLPELFFVTGSAWRWFGLPQLPQPLCARDLRLRETMAAHIAFWAGLPISAVEVRQPMFFRDAVQCGITMFVEALVRQGAVCGWQLHPRGMDVVLLELTLAAGAEERMALPLRGHQMGGSAVEEIAVTLQNLIGPATPGAAALG